MDEAVVEALPPGNGKACEVCEIEPVVLGDPPLEARIVIHALMNDFYVCDEHARLAVSLLRVVTK